MKRLKTACISNTNLTLFTSVAETVDHILAMGFDHFHNAIAINPEKIMQMRADNELLVASQLASFNYVDGAGVSVMLSCRTGRRVARIPGIELWTELMLQTVPDQIPVFILGSAAQVNSRTVQRLVDDMTVNVVGSCDGFSFPPEVMIDLIRNSGAKIVVIALGSPKQELFMEQCRNAGLTGFFMGVGGTFDVFSGTAKRAPKALRNLGLEWLYRVVKQPSRLRRLRHHVAYIGACLRGKL